MIYEIHSDESFTHIKKINTRFCFFFGGVFGSQKDMQQLDDELEQVKKKYSHYKEIKWNNLYFKDEHIYKEFLVPLFQKLSDKSSSIKYRQFCVDRKYVPAEKKELYLKDISSIYDIEEQFKLYYQFFKHSFGIKEFPESCSEIRFYIDQHTSKRFRQLKQFLIALPDSLNRDQLRISIKTENSKHNNHIQAVDLIIGASSFRSGDKRFSSYRVNSSPNKNLGQLKERIFKYIHDNLKKIYIRDFKTDTFDLFSDTSLEKKSPDLMGKTAKMNKSLSEIGFYRPKIHVLIFKPQKWIYDKGWDNKNLSKEGCHQNIHLSE